MKKKFFITVICFIVFATMLMIFAFPTLANAQTTSQMNVIAADSIVATQLSPAGSTTAINTGLFIVDTGQQAANNTSYDARITTAGATSNLPVAANMQIKLDTQNSAPNIFVNFMNTVTRILPFKIGTNIILTGISNITTCASLATLPPAGGLFIIMMMIGLGIVLSKFTLRINSVIPYRNNSSLVT